MSENSDDRDKLTSKLLNMVQKSGVNIALEEINRVEKDYGGFVDEEGIEIGSTFPFNNVPSINQIKETGSKDLKGSHKAKTQTNKDHPKTDQELQNLKKTKTLKNDKETSISISTPTPSTIPQLGNDLTTSETIESDKNETKPSSTNLKDNSMINEVQPKTENEESLETKETFKTLLSIQIPGFIEEKEIENFEEFIRMYTGRIWGLLPKAEKLCINSLNGELLVSTKSDTIIKDSRSEVETIEKINKELGDKRKLIQDGKALIDKQTKIIDDYKKLLNKKDNRIKELEHALSNATNKKESDKLKNPLSGTSAGQLMANNEIRLDELLSCWKNQKLLVKNSSGAFRRMGVGIDKVIESDLKILSNDMILIDSVKAIYRSKGLMNALYLSCDLATLRVEK